MVEATRENASQDSRIRTHRGGSAEAQRLTPGPGWHHAAVGGDVIVIDDTVWRGEARVTTLESVAAAPPYSPAPILDRVTDRRLPAGVLYPSRHVTGNSLRVLLTFGDGPGHIRSSSNRAAWPESNGGRTPGSR